MRINAGKFLSTALISCSLVIPSIVSAQPASAHTNWCFQGDTNNRLQDQPMNKGNCAALTVGGAAVAYFSGNATLANLLFNTGQNQWAAAAAKLSCANDPVSRQAAVRLIQACQCHNPGAQQSIENNQDEVIATLKARGSC